MDLRTIGSAIVRARKTRQISQRELARLVKATRERVSDWELDRRNPNETEWKRVVRHLPLSRNLLEKLRLEPLASQSEALSIFKPPPPGVYSQPADRKSAIRILAFYRSSPDDFNVVWKTLRESEDWLAKRRFLLFVVVDGKNEMEMWMRFLADGHSPAWLAPQRFGYRRLPVVDPIDRSVVGDKRMPALVRNHPSRPGIIWPQAPLLCENEVLRPDGLVMLDAHGQSRFCGLELDRTRVSDFEARRRCNSLRMPVLRYSPEQMRHPDFPTRMWDDAYAVLWPAGGPTAVAA